MLPEVVGLDQWGYPVVHEPVTHDLLGMAKSTVKACPTLALRLVAVPKRH
jgi:ferredoxin